MVANARGCSITADAFHTFPKLRGRSRKKLDAPRFHLSEKFHVNPNQLPAVDELKPAELSKLDISNEGTPADT
jgi:hypothetical protein